jgi:hypothetical protein
MCAFSAPTNSTVKFGRKLRLRRDFGRLRESELAGLARRGRERPAEQASELASEETLEARACGASFGADHALESSAMLEKLRGSVLVPAAAEACGGHVPVIGGDTPAHDPWRE